MNRFKFLFVLFSVALLFGCGNCGDNNSVIGTESGRINVTPDPIAFSQVAIGDSEEISVLVLNLDPEPLTLFDIQLQAREGGSAEGLELVELPDFPVDIPEDGQVEFRLKYTPSEDQPPAEAELLFPSTDSTFTRDEPKTVRIDALGNEPRLEVLPDPVRFARMPPGERDSQEVVIRNVGSAPLRIWEKPEYSGGEDFRVAEPSGSFPVALQPYDPDAAQDNPGEYELALDVEYAPVGNGADTGEILIISNDPVGEVLSEDGGLRTSRIVEVRANADAPCILVDGLTRNFGQVPIGSASGEIVTVSNCGTQPLEISSIAVTENTADDEFELDLQSWDANDDGELDTSVVLQPNNEETFFIRYTPAQVGADTGTVTIRSNDPIQGELELDLVGRGSEGICPVAQAGAYIRGVNSTPRQSLSAAPLQYIVLDGSDSFDEDGRVAEYNWRAVEWPDGGSMPMLGPTREDIDDTDMSKREFRLLTAGEYVFELTVVDNEGFESCDEPARVIIRAVPNEKVHVELTWTNPEDPDETDEVGSDVDVHLVKMGPGNWFETPYDIYFRNPNNSAGSESNGIWNPESPSLDIDDRDGGGPENIQMNDPANCEWYAVGVHYYRQLFGTAYVTVRIYINAQLVYEAINKPMTRGGQFWDVARIHWDSGQIYEYDNVFEAAPASMAPDVTAGMSNSGLCTAQDLYTVQ
jgi:hypothetical protein